MIRITRPAELRLGVPRRNSAAPEESELRLSAALTLVANNTI